MGGIAAVACGGWKEKLHEKEAAWGVCVVQEPAVDVHPSFTEVLFIKKVQKSLNVCDASGTLPKAGVD